MTVFNRDKNDYTKPSLFLGEANGLFDTVNKQYPEIWKIYKTIKSLDWDENEFDYSSCVKDFKNCDRSTYEMMIKTLAWQWEADSVASRISPVVGCFITSSELWAAWQRLSDQEVIHSATYSEIVRNSFDDPREILNEILKVEESFDRLDTISKTLSRCSKVAHNYAAGNLENTQEVYNSAFMLTVSLLVLERIQFMASFAVTFAIADTGLFQPIGKAVQKIAQDEFETHVDLDKAVLRNEMKTERGKVAFEQNKYLIKEMIDEVVASETEWINYLFSDGREIVGLNSEMLRQWMLFCAKDVYKFFDLDSNEKLPKNNPLRFIENWLDISKIQPSPQEQDNAQYKVGIMKQDDADAEFDIDF
jgi:ribonucleoside-diphosphate reductase beta chain